MKKQLQAMTFLIGLLLLVALGAKESLAQDRKVSGKVTSNTDKTENRV